MDLIITTPEDLRAIVRDEVAGLLAEGEPAGRDGTDSFGRKDWLTNSEARAYLGLSKTTLQRYRDNNVVAFAKVGSIIWYRRSDLDRLLCDSLQTPSMGASQ